MKTRYKVLIYTLTLCVTLYWMSGAPFKRGWSLFLAGAFTTLSCLTAIAICHGVEKTKEIEDE